MIFNKFNRQVAEVLRCGGIGVLPTDTIYGIVGSALFPKTVLRIYRVRERSFKKPMIILINSLADLKLFGVKLNRNLKKLLTKYWPGKVSVILPCRSKRFFYLHRGKKTLAFRLPAKKDLSKLLAETGPLVAPSANSEGKPPARTVKEAKKYFKNKVDFYVNQGKLLSPPSALITLKKGKPLIKRSGTLNKRGGNRQ